MKNNISAIWNSEFTNDLAEALAGINNVSDMRRFMRDIMTEKEILEISSRLEAAKMLTCGDKYTDIVKQTKLSSRTVARISDWLQNGTGGYELVINKHHAHTKPASAD